MIRNGEYANYKGKEFKITSSINDELVRLLSNNANDVELGFAQDTLFPRPNIFVKEVKKNEITRAYYVATKCKYQGREFQVVNENSDKILLFSGSGGIDGFTCVGHGEYEKWINKKDAEKIWEDFRPINGFPF